MQIRFPRKLRLGFRPLYGLTIRQLVYLAAFTVSGGMVILAGPMHAASILVRAIIGISLVCAGLVLAFLRIGGLQLDTWLPIVVRYLTRPRRRVWRKRDAARPQSQPPPPQKINSALSNVPMPRDVPMSQSVPIVAAPLENAQTTSGSVLVLIDAFVLGALGLFTYYLQRGGWIQVENFVTHIIRR